MIILILLMVMCMIFMYIGWYSDIKPRHKGVFKMMAMVLITILMLLFAAASFMVVSP